MRYERTLVGQVSLLHWQLLQVRPDRWAGNACGLDLLGSLFVIAESPVCGRGGYFARVNNGVRGSPWIRR